MFSARTSMPAPSPSRRAPALSPYQARTLPRGAAPSTFLKREHRADGLPGPGEAEAEGNARVARGLAFRSSFERKTAEAHDDRSSETPAFNGASARDLFTENEGRQLPVAVRRAMEPLFGYSFASVRLHTGSAGAETAAALSANAFTVGDRIAFGAGRYRPHTPDGMGLLAHELTHVVQQGFATPLSEARALSTSRRPALQRQPSGRISINVRQLRDLVRAQDPTLAALISNNPMNGRPAQAAHFTTSDRQFIFEIAVNLNPDPLAQMTGRRGETRPAGNPAERRAGQTTIVTQQIIVEVNTLRTSTPALRQQIPNTSDRLHSMLAETLMHELIHARLIMQRALPEGSAQPAVVADFERLRATALSHSFTLLREEVRSRASELLSLALTVARVSPPATGELSAFLDETVRYLTEEKFAAQRAARAFGRPRPNAEIAETYGDGVASRIESFVRSRSARGATRPSDSTLWPTFASSLKRDVLRLFNEMDREQAHPMDELMPPLMSTPLPPARPVSIGGRPVP